MVGFCFHAVMQKSLSLYVQCTEGEKSLCYDHVFGRIFGDLLIFVAIFCYGQL